MPDPMKKGLEAIHTCVAYALEDAHDQLIRAQDAELALRNYEAALRHDFNVKECEQDLLRLLAEGAA